MAVYLESNGKLRSPDGIELYWHSWYPPNPRAVLVLVHGLGEHCGRYGHLIKRMEEDGVAFFALDHRGHGKSQGSKGHLGSFDEYTQDLRLLVVMAGGQNPGLPLMMLGHSLGGLIAGRYALEYPRDLQALILSSAGLMQKKPLPVWTEKALGFFAKLAPRLAISNGLSTDDLSRDQSVVQAYIDDPLVHDRITIKWGLEFTTNQHILLERAGELTMPLLVFHGTCDNIVDYRGSQLLYEAASSQDKELYLFPGYYHETMNERMPERDQVLNMVADWINRHITMPHV